MLRFLLGLLLLGHSGAGFAIPEIARFGHFTCVSCHVSPGGGGVLTSYGRMFAAEKLSTWSYDQEENPSHGAFPLSDRYLFGGDVRWVDQRTSSGGSNQHRFWRMQTDLQAGINLRKFWLTATLGQKPLGPTSPPNNRVYLRGYEVRQDLFDDHLIIRGGLYIPKFGLMLADHTAYVRNLPGLGPDSEQTQLEAILQNDSLEVSLGLLVKDDGFERKGKSKSGFQLGAAIFVWDRNRINLNLLQTAIDQGPSHIKTTVSGVSSVVSMTSRIFGLMEVTKAATDIRDSITSSVTDSFAEFLSIGFEAKKGIIPSLRYEFINLDMSQKSATSQRYGAGVSWYPRPHLQLEGRFFKSDNRQAKQSKDDTQLVLHYYL